MIAFMTESSRMFLALQALVQSLEVQTFIDIKIFLQTIFMLIDERLISARSSFPHN